MSKSAWKFLFVSEYDLFTYLKTYMKRLRLPKYAPNLRAKTVNNWNYRFWFQVHQGKYIVRVRPTIYHTGYKLGSFTKTRKPFFFRSKKKR